MAPANLQEPGWTVREGQAIWRLPKAKAEIAGELVAASKEDGTAFVQFTKSPFPFVVAQSAKGNWEVSFPPQNKHYSGRGNPPRRLIWLYLPRALSGLPLPKNLTWEQDEKGWRLENRGNKESLEGYFNR